VREVGIVREAGVVMMMDGCRQWLDNADGNWVMHMDYSE